MLSIIIPNAQEDRILELVMKVEELFPYAEVIIATDRYRRGKGWAVREALSHATGHVICLLDGDFDIHPKMIMRLLPYIHEYDIVVGRKITSNLLSRRIITFLSRIYIRLLFGIPVDTQTGIKVFRRYAITTWKCDSFAFDIEILKKAKNNKLTMRENYIEASINKKVKLKSLIVAFIESLKILRY